MPEIYIELIQKLAKFHHGLSVFYIEQLETRWVETMKEFNNSSLSNQWLFNNNNNNNNSNYNSNDDDDDDEKTGNKNGLKQLWAGMGAFKDTYVSFIYCFIYFIDHMNFFLILILFIS